MNTKSKLRKYYISMVALFAGVITASTAILAFIIINRCEQYMLSNTSAFVSAEAIQLKLNINAHLDEIEGNVALMFADDDFTKYDSATTNLDDYDKINIESSIAGRIVDLGALENYSDFCVVYTNDNTVGWKSKTTRSMYSKGGLYEEMSSFINNEKTQSGWKFGVKDNNDRMYYIKRYNPNAIILTSFYTRELEKTFQYPEELNGMTVRLVDDTGNTVYSSNKEEIGTRVSADQMQYLDKTNDLSVITDTSLINTGRCENGWTVMCIVSRDDMMGEFNSLRSFAIIVAIVILVVVIGLVIAMLKKIAKPMDGYVEDLSEKAQKDVLSGVFNRRAFEELAIEQMTDASQKYAFIMLDMDYFKMVNDTLGHDYGDAIIRRMGRLLTDYFSQYKEEKPLIGRIGGDEFTVFLSLGQDTEKSDMEQLLNSLLEAFLQEFAVERKTLPLSLSAGVALSKDDFADYQKLYMAADAALYRAKENGKNQVRIYAGETIDE